MGECPLNWFGNRDEFAVWLADPRSGEPGDNLTIFTASDNWRAPQRSIPLGLDVDSDMATAVDRAFTQYAYSSTIRVGENSDGSRRFKYALLLSSLTQPGETRRLAESEGFFDIAGFTPNGRWLFYWRSDDIGIAVREDGLDFWAACINDGKSIDPKIATLVNDAMITISPTKDMVAVGGGNGGPWPRNMVRQGNCDHRPDSRAIIRQSAHETVGRRPASGMVAKWRETGVVLRSRRRVPR